MNKTQLQTQPDLVLEPLPRRSALVLKRAFPTLPGRVRQACRNHTCPSQPTLAEFPRVIQTDRQTEIASQVSSFAYLDVCTWLE